MLCARGCHDKVSEYGAPEDVDVWGPTGQEVVCAAIGAQGVEVRACFVADGGANQRDQSLMGGGEGERAGK